MLRNLIKVMRELNMKPTIYDVAKEAGVSIATVSKVINNTGRIGEKTKKNVLKAMETLNYYPSIVASALTGKKTKTIGLLVPDISNPFFAEIARSIEDRSHEIGFSVVICSTDNNKEKEKKYVSLLIRKSVDGFILSSGFENLDLVQQLSDQDIPIALLATDIPSLSITTVSVDDFKGGYEATKHLLSLKHRKISIIAEHARSSIQRINGFKEALAESGINFEEKSLVKTSATIENGKKVGLKLLRLKERPTAIFACNDLLAIGVIHAAKEVGINIPDELSVVGFDNTILSTITEPRLTTISQPIQDMGAKVIDMLIEEIEKETTLKQKMLFWPELIVRESTSELKNV